MALAGVWGLHSPATAGATIVSLDTLNAEGGILVLGVANETNELTVRAEPGSPTPQLIFEETGDNGAVPPVPTPLITTAPQCVVVATQEVQCDSAGLRTLTAQLGGGNDMLRLDDSSSTVAAIASAAIFGGAGDDELVSGAGPQVLVGGDDNDRLEAGAGNDFLQGFDGVDTALGGPGQDSLRGGGGNDHLFGGDGPDFVGGDDGDDELSAEGGDDDVRGGNGADIVGGGEGADRLEAPDPADLANEPTAGRGPDTVSGGPGNDRLGGGPDADPLDADVFSGGGGEDTIEYALRRSPLVITLDGNPDDGAHGESDNVGADIQHVVGGSDRDRLVGTAGANVLDGGLEDDQLTGLGGDDILQGGVNDGGSDTLVGGAGRDVLTGNSGDDSLEGGVDDDDLFGDGGSDTLEGGNGQDEVAGGPGGDSLHGGAGDDRLNGGNVVLIGADGDDKIRGGPGSDELLGGPGDDTLDGGLGADRISGEDGLDAVSYRDRATPITVTLDGAANDGERGEGDNVLDDIENVLSGPDADTLSGDARANVFDGGGGDDYLTGGAGPDRLAGGTGIDLLRARDGTRDVVSCGKGVDLAVVDRFDRVKGCDSVDRGRRRRPPLGRAALTRPERGTVALRLPSASRFVPLHEAVEVPLGSTLDARKGTVRVVTTKRRGGTVQEGSFHGGAFTVHQRKVARPVTMLRLTGGNFASCPASVRGRAGVRARLRVRIAKSPGKYRVRGRYSRGGSLGTTWWTVDRCDGTWTRVVAGTVRVRDFRRHRTFVVKAGEEHFARAR